LFSLSGIYLSYIFNIKITASTINAMQAVIQNGLNTHHQDQSITLHNFRTINASSNKLVKHTPLLDEFDFDIFYNFV